MNKAIVALTVVLLALSGALAATTNLTVGGSAALSGVLGGQAYVVSKSVDFEASSASSNDVLQLINVPADCWVLAVGCDVTEAEGSALTCDIGDGSDTDGYLNDVNLNSAAAQLSTPAYTYDGTNVNTVGYSSGKFYTSADTIDLLLGDDATNAKVTVSAVIVPVFK